MHVILYYSVTVVLRYIKEDNGIVGVVPWCVSIEMCCNSMARTMAL